MFRLADLGLIDAGEERVAFNRLHPEIMPHGKRVLARMTTRLAERIDPVRDIGGASEAARRLEWLVAAIAADVMKYPELWGHEFSIGLGQWHEDLRAGLEPIWEFKGVDAALLESIARRFVPGNFAWQLFRPLGAELTVSVTPSPRLEEGGGHVR